MSQRGATIRSWGKIVISAVSILLCASLWWALRSPDSMESAATSPPLEGGSAEPSEGVTTDTTRNARATVAASAETGPGMLLVRVRSRENEPVSGCLVRTVGMLGANGDVATEAPENHVAELLTDPDGICKFTGLPLGYYSVTAHTGDLGGHGTARFFQDRKILEIEILLGPGGSISGEVTTRDGKPCAGAEIFPVARDGFAISEDRFRTLSVMADENGRFVIPFLEAQSWDLLAEFPGHRTEGNRDVQVGASDVRVIMEPAARLAGRVISSEQQAPVVGMGLTAHTRGVPLGVRCVTDGEGKFEFTELSEGEVSLMGQHPTLTLAPSPTIAEAKLNGSSELILEARSGARVSGRVVSNNGVGVSGVRVGINGENGGAFVATDKEGGYRFENVAPGDYTVYTSAAPPEESRSIQVAPNVEMEVPDWIVNLKILRGIVLDSAEAPVVNAHVRVLKGGPIYEQLTDDNGEFQAAEPGIAGEVVVVASKHEVASDPVSINLDAEESPYATLILSKPRGVLGGRVVGHNGKSVKASLTLSNYEGFPGADGSIVGASDGPAHSGGLGGASDAQLSNWDVMVNTDSEGYFLAHVDTPSDIMIFLATYSPHGICDKTLLVEQIFLRPGQSKMDLRLIFPQGGDGRIGGSVIDEKGTPLPNVSVFCSEEGGGDTISTISRNDGRFVLEGLEGDTFEIRVNQWGYHFVTISGIRVGTDGVVVTLKRPDILTGFVRDARTGASVTSFEAGLIGWQVKNFDPQRLRRVGNADGYFELDVPSGGDSHDMDLVVIAAGYESVRQSLGRITSNLKPVEVRLEPNESRLGGTVVDADGGPIASARVTARLLEGSASTGEVTSFSNVDGAFSFSGLPAGRYLVEVAHEAYAPSSVEVESPHGEDVMIALTVGGELAGWVGFEGKPVEGLSLRAAGGPVIYPDADGQFILQRVPPGEALIEIRVPGPEGTSETRTISAMIEDGATTTTRIDIGVEGINGAE